MAPRTGKNPRRKTDPKSGATFPPIAGVIGCPRDSSRRCLGKTAGMERLPENILLEISSIKSGSISSSDISVNSVFDRDSGVVLDMLSCLITKVGLVGRKRERINHKLVKLTG
jgi:hypothetical protein